MGFIKKLQLLLVLFLFTSNVWGAEVPHWFDKPLTPGGHLIVGNKDYYHNKFKFDTTKPCTGVRCFNPGTAVYCSSYEYKKSGSGQFQFCNVSAFKPKDGELTPVRAGRRITMVTGYIGLSSSGKPRFTPRVPVNKVIEWDIQGNLIPAQQHKPAPPPKPTPLPEPESKSEAVGDCNIEGCEPSVGLAAELVADAKKNIIDPLLTPAPPSVTAQEIGAAMKAKVKGIIFNPKCYGFIEADGSFGDWGKEAVKSFKSVCHECFFGPNAVNVNALCPNFNNFSQLQKEYFWVWVYASMSQAEASCDPIEEAMGTNGMADGLLQMERSYELRKPPKRGIECSTVGSETTKSNSFQFRCAASIIRDTRWADGKPLWGTNGKNDQYWEKLKHTSGKISKFISTFPACPKKKSGGKK